jgi:hypothetical protein
MKTYRELSQDEIDSQINPICERRGWMPLNINPQTPTCTAIGAFEGDELVGWGVIQLVPMIGPFYVEPEHRDGEASRGLADAMHKLLSSYGSRGSLAIADSPVTERLCEAHGMARIASPVYLKVGV